MLQIVTSHAADRMVGTGLRPCVDAEEPTKFRYMPAIPARQAGKTAVKRKLGVKKGAVRPVDDVRLVAAMDQLQ
jgi:hypothetical protein